MKDFTHRTAKLRSSDKGHVLEFVRGVKSADAQRSLKIIANLTDQAQESGTSLEDVLLFSSESKVYGGERKAEDPSAHMSPYECLVFGPSEWLKFGGSL